MQPHTAFCLGIAVSGLICYALFSFFCSLFFALPSYSCLFPVLNASVSQAKFSPFSTVAFTLGIHGEMRAGRGGPWAAWTINTKRY